jgi:hypothetical protein
MSRQDPKTKVAPIATTPADTAALPRSGAGAGTALAAMLKKRQMRPSRDSEPQVPDATVNKTAGD